MTVALRASTPGCRNGHRDWRRRSMWKILSVSLKLPPCTTRITNSVLEAKIALPWGKSVAWDRRTALPINEGIANRRDISETQFT